MTGNRIGSILVVLALTLDATPQEPQLKWSYEALSNLYAPPLVADLHPQPGLETIVSDSEARRVRCISAAGEALWELDGQWRKRLPAAASLSRTARPGKTTLIVGGSDGKIGAFDGATGTLLWTRPLGAITWGAVIWADLDGDGHDEAVAATESAGILAIDIQGDVLWRYGAAGSADPLLISCPPATADVDGDGADEVFVVDRQGPLCLNGRGALQWSTRTGHHFVSAPVIADANGDGDPELYCAAHTDPATLCLDARSGAIAWVFPMLGPADVYPSSSIAVGDLIGDQREEIVTADNHGHVCALSADGAPLWIFATDKRVHAAPSLGDVDGDQDVEVLVASGDRTLYCLGSDGALEWRYRAELRLIHPATIADVDQDGMTDILFCGSDRKLRCLTLGGRYVAARIPWGARRFDGQQSGSSFGKRPAWKSTAHNVTRSLLTAGGFDQPKVTQNPPAVPAGSGADAVAQRRPRGWQQTASADAVWELDGETKKEGTAALKVVAGTEQVDIVSEPIVLAKTLRRVSASVWMRGRHPVGTARLQWLGRDGVLREDALRRSAGDPDQSDQWLSLTLPAVIPPRRARWLRLALTSTGGPVWWDSADVVGTFTQTPELRAMVNQVGYDVGAPKRFTAQSNFNAKAATFELVDPSGATVYQGQLQSAGRIHGAFGHDWGYHYWRGAFDPYDAPGRYRIRITLDGATDISWPFRIGDRLLWTETSRPAYRFFYYQRCGMAIAGFHAACHLDDAVGHTSGNQYALRGGWHDAGDYNTYHNAPYTFGLARAYGAWKAPFDQQDEDGNGRSDFLDEILWGGDHSRRMIAPDGSAYGGITTGYGFWGPPELETDNVPATGDERTLDRDPDTGRDSGWHVAAMARIARLVADPAPLIEAAQRGFEWRQAKRQRDFLQWSAAVDLLALTKQEKYATIAKALFAECGLSQLASCAPHAGELSYLVDALERHDALLGTDHRATLQAELVKKAEALLELSQNPFGIITHGPKKNPNFFGTPAETSGWHVGTSSFLCNAAGAMALAYRYQPDPRYLAFVYDQFNWTLGNNPFDLSLMEGQGSFNPPTYHHRYTFAGVPRGAVPGSVVNGISYRGPGDDRPYFDLRGLDIPNFTTNEVWLPHNTAYLNALVNLQRGRHQSAAGPATHATGLSTVPSGRGRRPESHSTSARSGRYSRPL